MKKTTAILLLSAIAIIISCSTLDAQVTKIRNAASYADAGDIVTVNNASAKINNLFIMDSVKSPHIASFEIELNSTGDTKKIQAIINLLRPLGIKEVVRTGRIAIAREEVKVAQVIEKKASGQ